MILGCMYVGISVRSSGLFAFGDVGCPVFCVVCHCLNSQKMIYRRILPNKLTPTCPKLTPSGMTPHMAISHPVTGVLVFYIDRHII